MGIEIERRWLVASAPADWLQQAQASHIRQGYLIAETDRSLRIRDRDGERTMTSKSGRGLTRQEQELPITQAQFDVLWPLTADCRIEKTRYSLAQDKLVLELDIFAGVLAPLIVLEAEFADEAQARAFSPPDFAGRDITEDGRFTNAALSRSGLPADWNQP